MAYSGAYRMREPAEPPEHTEHMEHTEPARPARENQPPRRQQDKLSGAVGALMKKLESMSTSMETDDLIMALILYLMYRESGDKDLLIMLGAMLLT